MTNFGLSLFTQKIIITIIHLLLWPVWRKHWRIEVHSRWSIIIFTIIIKNSQLFPHGANSWHILSTTWRLMQNFPYAIQSFCSWKTILNLYVIRFIIILHFLDLTPQHLFQTWPGGLGICSKLAFINKVHLSVIFQVQFITIHPTRPRGSFLVQTLFSLCPDQTNCPSRSVTKNDYYQELPSLYVKPEHYNSFEYFFRGTKVAAQY